MNESALVRELHGAGKRGDQFGGLPRGLRFARELLGETSPLKELHCEVACPDQIADVENLHDVGMPDRSHGLRFALESRSFDRICVAARAHRLQRHAAI